LQAELVPETHRAVRARAEEVVTRALRKILEHELAADELLLENAEALAQLEEDEPPSSWRGPLQERLAELYRRRGDRDRAIHLLERAERSTAHHGPSQGDLRAIIEARLASLAGELGDRDRARRALGEALDAAQRQTADGSARWRDLDPIAYEQAFAGAIDTAETLGDPASAARAAFLLADFHGRRGAWERAAPIAEQALRAARRASEPILVARAYRLLADVALHGSRYEDARASYEEAIRRLDELGAEELAATSRLLYINLLLHLNRREAATRHVEWLRGYLAHAPASWPYHAEAEQTLRLSSTSATKDDG
jgi:tetratricopeptide (TPR) repeat protein